MRRSARCRTCGRCCGRGIAARAVLVRRVEGFHVAAALLSVAHVFKSFGGVAAVRDVSLELSRGEIRGLIGPNGSGKTTLLNLIGGQEHPDRGEIRLAGDAVDSVTPDALAARGVARTF